MCLASRFHFQEPQERKNVSRFKAPVEEGERNFRVASFDLISHSTIAVREFATLNVKNEHIKIPPENFELVQINNADFLREAQTFASLNEP